MNTPKNKRIVAAGAFLFLLATFFPPWIYTFDLNGARGGHTTSPAGYSCIFWPPEPKYATLNSGVKIDAVRLAMEWLAILALAGTTWFLLKNDQPRRDEPRTPADGTECPPPPGRMDSTPPDDQALLAEIKFAAKQFNCSPSHLVKLGVEGEKFNRYAVIPNFGPNPHTIDEAVIDAGILAAWPDWVAKLVPHGSKWERLHWPDGSMTIRLVNSQALVLAAKFFGPAALSSDAPLQPPSSQPLSAPKGVKTLPIIAELLRSLPPPTPERAASSRILRGVPGSTLQPGPAMISIPSGKAARSQSAEQSADSKPTAPPVATQKASQPVAEGDSVVAGARKWIGIMRTYASALTLVAVLVGSLFFLGAWTILILIGLFILVAVHDAWRNAKADATRLIDTVLKNSEVNLGYKPDAASLTFLATHPFLAAKIWRMLEEWGSPDDFQKLSPGG